MGKITKKNLKKHFKGVYKKKGKKNSFGKEIEQQVKSIALQELDAHGDQGMDKIVIDNVSIEIWPEDPNTAAPTEVPDMRATGVNPVTATATDSASTRCFYYCYVIGGRRICQRICW